jgi:CheY-like chemotaxis protein
MKTILVVDDEFGIGEVLEAILTDEGYRVLTAINGQQALERLAGNRIDLVISDLMMPVMDGAALLERLRGIDRYRDIPFILMCSLPEEATIGRVSGYAAFLRKPFRVPELVSVISLILDNMQD